MNAVAEADIPSLADFRTCVERLRDNFDQLAEARACKLFRLQFFSETWVHIIGPF